MTATKIVPVFARTKNKVGSGGGMHPEVLMVRSTLDSFAGETREKNGARVLCVL
jgi:hypothetical protein